MGLASKFNLSSLHLISEILKMVSESLAQCHEMHVPKKSQWAKKQDFEVEEGWNVGNCSKYKTVCFNQSLNVTGAFIALKTKCCPACEPTLSPSQVGAQHRFTLSHHFVLLGGKKKHWRRLILLKQILFFCFLYFSCVSFDFSFASFDISSATFDVFCLLGFSFARVFP